MKLKDILRDQVEVLDEPGAAGGAPPPDANQFDRTDDDPPAQPPAEKKDEPDPALTNLEKQFADFKKDTERTHRQLEERAQQAEQAAQFWQQKAAGESQPKDTPKGPPDDDGEEIDIVEALAAGDKPKIRKYFKSLGAVTKEELDGFSDSFVERIDKRIKTERQAITEETKIYTEFPDLKNADSELFKATREEYQALAGSDFGKSPQALELAAHRAAARLGTRPANGNAAQGETPEERERRIAAQSGGGKNGKSAEISDDGALTPAQKRICKQMGISEDAYRKRAQGGIQVSLNTFGMSEAMERSGRGA